MRSWDHQNFRYFLEVPPAPALHPCFWLLHLLFAQEALRLAA